MLPGAVTCTPPEADVRCGNTELPPLPFSAVVAVVAFVVAVVAASVVAASVVGAGMAETDGPAVAANAAAAAATGECGGSDWDIVGVRRTTVRLASENCAF